MARHTQAIHGFQAIHGWPRTGRKPSRHGGETMPPRGQLRPSCPKMTEARTQGTTDWIRNHARSNHRHRPPGVVTLGQTYGRKGRRWQVGFYQLLSGHAPISSYLAERSHTIRSSECWWCHSGERRSRYHLFFRCRRWAPESRKVWKSVGEACGRKHPKAPSACLAFQGDSDSGAGGPELPTGGEGRKIFNLASLERGRGEIEQRSQEGKGARDDGEEDRPGPR